MDSTFFSLQDEHPPMQKWGVGHLSLCLRGLVIKKLFWLEFLYRRVYCVVVMWLCFYNQLQRDEALSQKMIVTISNFAGHFQTCDIYRSNIWDVRGELKSDHQ